MPQARDSNLSLPQQAISGGRWSYTYIAVNGCSLVDEKKSEIPIRSFSKLANKGQKDTILAA